MMYDRAVPIPALTALAPSTSPIEMGGRNPGGLVGQPRLREHSLSKIQKADVRR